MKVKPWYRALAVSVFASLAVLATNDTLAQSAQKVTIRTDFTPAGTHAALHLAHVKGWFKDSGLDVNLQDGKGSINTMQLVATGDVDIGQLSVSIVPAARESGMKVKSIATFARRSDLAVIVRADSNIKTAKDLLGKRLVLFAASPWTPMIDPFLAKAGLKRSDVTILFVDVNAMYSTYGSGQADAVLTLAPFALPIVNKITPSRAIDAADSGILLPALGLVTREEMIQKRPEVVRKVVEITIRGWEYIRAGNVEEAAAAIIKNRPDAKLDPGVLQGQARGYLDYFDTPNTKGKPVGWQSEEDWKQALALLRSAGLVKSNMTPQDVFTNAFIPAK